MKRSRIIILLLVLALPLCAKEVTVDKAEMVAKNFLLLKTASGSKGSAHFELTHIQLSSAHAFGKNLKKSTASKENLIYLFQIKGNSGFIIISGDDDATPVLGYSLGNNLDVSNVPDNFRKWVEGYKNQIRQIRSNPELGTTEIKDQWERLISGKSI